MAEYSRRSGSKAPTRTYRSKRGMRERRDLRSLDKEDDEEKMFKAPSRRRVYELKAIADTAGPEQGMTACCSNGCNQLYRNSVASCCVPEVTSAKLSAEPLYNLNSLQEHENESATDLHDVFDTGFCVDTKDNHCNKQNQKEPGRIDGNTSDTDVEMHAAQDAAQDAVPQNTDFSCDKLSELLESIKITCDMNSPDVAIKTINSDAVKLLTVELPCRKSAIDKNTPSEKGYSEPSTSYVMYFSEGDLCRPLESPPEDEEGMSGGSSQQEEERKHGGGGGGSSKSRSHSPHRSGSGSGGGSVGGGSSFSSGSSHGSSTRQSRSESRSTAERGRAMSPGSQTRQLSSIPESRTEGDGDNTEKTTKDSVEKKPSSSGKVGNYQGHVPAIVMQGGRDENQNKTSWKSVLQTNLSERIDNVGTKDAGFGAAKDPQKMGFNVMQVNFFCQWFDTCKLYNGVFTPPDIETDTEADKKWVVLDYV